MSRENVELVRRRYDAINRADLATLVELTHPDAVWWDRPDDPGSAPHRGRDAGQQHLAEILESVELHVEPEQFFDAGDQVVAGVRLVGRGRAGGVPFEEHEFHVFTLRDGRVTATREYRDRAEALEAAGLTEQDARAGS
jgi:ketosteroid isomerase-like protein